MTKSKEKFTENGIKSMEKTCDLHAHTHFSDGSLSPTELVRMAKEAGISALAVTDHNNIGGLPELFSAAEGSGVHPVSGIEFSTNYRDKEIHILALGFPESAYPRINEVVEDVKRMKHENIQELIRDLIDAGYDIDPERMKRGALGIVNRAHVATELVRCGYVSTRAEAFAGILRSGGRFYTSPRYMETSDCVDLIRSLGGGVSVLAHPFLNVDEKALRELLDELRGRLDAMEVYYSEYDEQTTRLSMQIAREYGLLPSGGSDFHGRNKPDIAIGRGKGDLHIPLSLAEDMGLLK